jgi:hypothetical protein
VKQKSAAGLEQVPGRAVVQWESHGAGRLPVNGSVTYKEFLFPSVVAKPYAHSAIRKSCGGWKITLSLRREPQISGSAH